MLHFTLRYTFNFYNILQFGDDTMTRMQTFMEDTLAAARANGEKVSEGCKPG